MIACPYCGETRISRLVWYGGELKCETCGERHDPEQAKAETEFEMTEQPDD